MTTYTVAKDAITARVNKADHQDFLWQQPDLTPINMTGCSIAAELEVNDVVTSITATIDSPTTGAFSVDWTATPVATLPLGALSLLRITITDTDAQDHVMVWPVNGVE